MNPVLTYYRKLEATHASSAATELSHHDALRELLQPSTSNRRGFLHTRRQFTIPPRPTPAESCATAASSPTVSTSPKALGVSRQALSNLVNGHASLSAEMAVRLGKAFDTDPELWIRLQAAYDIAQTHKWADDIRVKRYGAAPLALD